LQGKVYLSCGHEDTYRPISGWPLTVKDYDTFSDGSYGKCITNSNVCLDCYIKYIGTYPENVILEPWEEQDYLFEDQEDN